jgi:hypothetical protein
MNTKTHSVYIEDKKKGHQSEIFCNSLTAAVELLEELHQWARDNDYAPGRDYALTLSKI